MATRLSFVHLLATLLGLVAIAGVVIAFARPPSAKPIDAPPREFSAMRALVDVRGLTSTGMSHPVGGRDHNRARDWLMGRLRALGIEPQVQEAQSCSGPARCAHVQNVMGRIEGTEGVPAVMLSAHYDSVPAGPGAADDGAGVSVVLEILRALQASGRPRRTVIALFTDGEELGLLGARAFVKEHPWSYEAKVALEFEARGTSGQTAMFETSEDAAWLVAIYGRVVSRPTASSVIFSLYKALPNDTDLTVFKAARMQGLNFAFADEVWNYHTENDDVAHLDPRSVQHMGDQGLAVARALADVPQIPAANGDAVWFDLFSLALVVYRAWVAFGLALLQVVLAVFGIRRAIRMGSLRSSSVVGGAGRAFAMVVFAIVAGLALAVMVAAFARHPRSSADPLPTWIAYLACAVAVSAATPRLLRGRARDGDDGVTEATLAAWSGTVLLWTLSSIASTVLVLGSSYLFTLPALAASVGLIVATTPRIAGGWKRWGAMMLPVAIAALLWFPLLRVLLVMVGAQLSPTVTFPVAWFLTAALPLLTALEGRSRDVVPVAAVMAMIAATVTAVVR